LQPPLRVELIIIVQETNPSHSFGLLRPRRERPGSCGAAEQRDELAPFHSIT
jgi:hypothetical protein